MLLGEYAVLHGHHALVCAIDKYMSVTLTPRDDEKIIIDSALGHYETSLNNLQGITPFQFVLTAINSLKKYLSHGCHLKIESEFSSTVGFASSAAVTVATLTVLSEWLELSLSKSDLIKLGRDVVREVQGAGSGADIAASVLGGIVHYRMEPFIAEKLSLTYPLTVVYSGYKTKTAIAIKQVQVRFADLPEIFANLMKTINACVIQGIDALNQQNWQKFANLMNIQQGLMDALGVNTAAMQSVIILLKQQPNLLGAKISGSGLGDCLVALGESLLDPDVLRASGAQQIKVSMNQEGVGCEKV